MEEAYCNVTVHCFLLPLSNRYVMAKHTLFTSVVLSTFKTRHVDKCVAFGKDTIPSAFNIICQHRLCNSNVGVFPWPGVTATGTELCTNHRNTKRMAWIHTIFTVTRGLLATSELLAAPFPLTALCKRHSVAPLGPSFVMTG